MNVQRPRQALPIVLAVLVITLFFAGSHVRAATFIVDGNNSAAKDTNPGTPEQPFATIATATKSLTAGDTVLIKAGIYREAVTIDANGDVDKPITIAAFPGDEGKVIITGSDLIESWKQLSPVVYTTPWSLSLDCHYPDGWIKKTAVGDYGPYAKRCEMVFINDQPVQEVLATGLMRRGTFTIDETRHELRLALADPSMKLKEAEVSVRQQGLHIRGNRLIIRGISVIHVANPYFVGAFTVEGNDDLIENCHADWNNLDGFLVRGSRLKLLGNVGSHNGETGMSLSIQDSRVENNETDDNSWRYGPGWAEGGIKCIGGEPAGNTFIKHISKNNLGAGIWLDTCGGNNRVERCWLENNEVGGLEFETCLGENTAVNNVISRTRGIPNALYPEADGAGILAYETGNLTIINNTLVNNEHCGIIFAGGERGPGKTCANETVYNNILAGNGLAGISFWVRGKAAEPAALATYRFDYNLWMQPDGKFGILPKTVVSNLSQWQQAFGQDLHSLSQDACFVAAEKRDYHLQPTSPAIGKGTKIELSDDFDGHLRNVQQNTIGAYTR